MEGLEWLKEEEASSPPDVAVMRSDHQGRTSGLHAISFGLTEGLTLLNVIRPRWHFTLSVMSIT